jgi:hypothetical protein
MNTVTTKHVRNFEIVDHGPEHSQYFQGCGVSGTKYDDVVTGIGNTPAEALSDALDSLAQNGWEDLDQIEAWDGWCSRRLDYDVHNTCDIDLDDHAECEVYYFVSVQVSSEGEG